MATLQSRISDLITAIGADIKSLTTGQANRALKSNTYASDPATAGFWAELTVSYATTGSSSPVMEVWYTGSATDSSLASFWLNENGAARCAMPKAADSALKVVGWGTGQSVHTFLVEQRSGAGTGGRSSQWGINVDGNPVLGANEVVGAHAVVIASGASAPPTGTPVGTIVFKKRV
jgi:hypothetical protein